jgi:hypothetical protein
VAMALPALSVTDGDQQLHMLMDDARGAMEDSMDSIRHRCRTYLRWYSPPWNADLGRHDAWEDAIDYNEDVGTTRSNFPISRAVVDIWTSLEAARSPIARAEPEHTPPPLPVLDEDQRAIAREQYNLERRIQGIRSEIRGRHFRDYMRKDQFPLKHHRAVRRKNLYGFSWMMVLPDSRHKAPASTVLRNPTTVYPIWSTRDPDELEAVLSVQQESAVRANIKYGLGLRMEDGRVAFQQGGDYGRYTDINDDYFYDDSRTKVWVEDFWWAEREFHPLTGLPTKWGVHNVKRVCGRIVQEQRTYPWFNLPFVFWQNEDERDEFGWSEVAGVMDINDEFNRRLSEEGDILSMYAHPRFQLIGALGDRDDVELPAGDEIVALQDPERIEQILARIDVYPNQIHVQTLIDMLHRVTGLPPIVWGLIANAQTSGRALTASWKATEARLVPKLMSNGRSIRRYADIAIDYARAYDWNGGKRVWADRNDQLFDDVRWTFPPMEPRDFQEVTMDAITRRDAGLTTTIKAMRDTGDENAEETAEEVAVEFRDPAIHPDKAQAQILYLDARLQLMERAMAMQAQQQQGAGGMPSPLTPATVNQAVGQARAGGAEAQAAAPPGAEGALPPTQPGAPGNAGQPVPPQGGGGPPPDETLTAGTLVRGGDVSNQLLQTRRLR